MEKEKGTSWQKPELIALVRSKPEEAVLAACKDNKGAGSGGPGYTQATCEPYVKCSICSDVVSS